MLMLGFYNYTVILTYLSLFSSLGGIFAAFAGHSLWAVACLMVSGLCDAFDGKIARTRLKSTDQEKRFGIQIDSLCDLVCFGILPCCIGYSIGMKRPFYLLIFFIYLLAALIRLAYFNVMEEERQQQTNERRRFYCGLPVTSVSLILPVVYAIRIGCGKWGTPLFAAAMLLIAFLFVCNFKLRKPGLRGILLLIAIGLLEFAIVLLFKRGLL